MVGNSGREPRIALEEGVHPIAVAGEDYHQVVAVVLHDLQEDLDRLLAIVALVLGAIEVIGFVDEEDAAHRPLEDFLGLGRGMSNVLAHQIVAGDGDEVPFADISKPVEDLRHAQRHRRLAGAGIAGEAHMQAGRTGGEAQLVADPVHQQERRSLPDAALDRPESHQLAVELIEDLLDLRVPEGSRQIDGGLVRQAGDGRIHFIPRRNTDRLRAFAWHNFQWCSG